MEQQQQPPATNPVTYSVAYPEKLSRGQLLLKSFFGWLYVGIPHSIVLYIYGIALAVTIFIAWWAIFFTGKYPKGLFDFAVGYSRWTNRVSAYLSLQTDKLPPYSTRP